MEKTSFLKNAVFVGVSESKYFDSIICLMIFFEYYFQNKKTGYDLHQTDIYLLSTLVAKEDYYKVDGLRISFRNIAQKIVDTLMPTKDTFNTGKETVPVSADDFKFFEQAGIENLWQLFFYTIKVTFLTDLL